MSVAVFYWGASVVFILLGLLGKHSAYYTLELYASTCIASVLVRATDVYVFGIFFCNKKTHFYFPVVFSQSYGCTQYDLLSQQQLSFLFIYLKTHTYTRRRVSKRALNKLNFLSHPVVNFLNVKLKRQQWYFVIFMLTLQMIRNSEDFVDCICHWN